MSGRDIPIEDVPHITAVSSPPPPIDAAPPCLSPVADALAPPSQSVQNKKTLTVTVDLTLNEDPFTMVCRTLYNIWPVVLLCLLMTAMSIVFRNQIITVCTVTTQF